MNKVIMLGRLTKDPEVRYSQGQNATAVCKYSIAVNRSYKRDGEPDADFFNCTSFGKAGEFVGKYFRKGQMIALVGELRNGSYTDRDGNKRYTTDIITSEVHFAGSKNDNGNAQPSAPSADFAPANAGPAPRQQAQPVQQQAIPQDGFVPYQDETDVPF